MAEFVRFTLDDGSQVLFESAESDLVALHGGPPDELPRRCRIGRALRSR